MYEVGLDIRSQLRVFEQIDEVERKKRDARERDILMRAARVRHSIHCQKIADKTLLVSFHVGLGRKCSCSFISFLLKVLLQSVFHSPSSTQTIDLKLTPPWKQPTTALKASYLKPKAILSYLQKKLCIIFAINRPNSLDKASSQGSRKQVRR